MRDLAYPRRAQPGFDQWMDDAYSELSDYPHKDAVLAKFRSGGCHNGIVYGLWCALPKASAPRNYAALRKAVDTLGEPVELNIVAGEVVWLLPGGRIVWGTTFEQGDRVATIRIDGAFVVAGKAGFAMRDFEVFIGPRVLIFAALDRILAEADRQSRPVYVPTPAANTVPPKTKASNDPLIFGAILIAIAVGVVVFG